MSPLPGASGCWVIRRHFGEDSGGLFLTIWIELLISTFYAHRNRFPPGLPRHMPQSTSAQFALTRFSIPMLCARVGAVDQDSVSPLPRSGWIFRERPCKTQADRTGTNRMMQGATKAQPPPASDGHVALQTIDFALGSMITDRFDRAAQAPRRLVIGSSLSMMVACRPLGEKGLQPTAPEPDSATWAALGAMN